MKLLDDRVGGHSYAPHQLTSTRLLAPEQVTAFARADGRDGEVIDHLEIDLGDGGEAFVEAAVGVTEAELLEQAGSAQIRRGHALEASLVSEGATKKGLLNCWTARGNTLFRPV
jgi:hypothetical protein